MISLLRFFISNIWERPRLLVGSITFQFPPAGTVLISSAVISPRTRRCIDLTRRSISHEVTDHHPITERSREAADLVTLDFAPLTSEVWFTGRRVWRRDAGLDQYQRRRRDTNVGSPRGGSPTKQSCPEWPGCLSIKHLRSACTRHAFLTSLFVLMRSDFKQSETMSGLTDHCTEPQIRTPFKLGHHISAAALMSSDCS